MKRIALAALALAGLMLSSFAAHVQPVAAVGNEQPVIVSAYANAPGAITIAWDHSGDGVYWFNVEEQSAGFLQADLDKRIFTVLKLQPSHTYHFRVCAVYDFNKVCSDANGVGYVSVTTLPAAAAPAPPPGSGSSSGDSLPPLTAPTNVKVSNITSTGATVTWQPSTGMTGPGIVKSNYQILTVDKENQNSYTYGYPTGTSYPLTNLGGILSHAYVVTVCAVRYVNDTTTKVCAPDVTLETLPFGVVESAAPILTPTRDPAVSATRCVFSPTGC
jgi:hypothetical protein